MNTPTTVLDLIRDDAHAAGFQSLGQYRKALIEAATAAATITIGETHSPVKVRLGLRLIGDEEVAIITLTQHDRTVTLNCVDQAHAARIAEAIEGLTAAPAVQGEPVAWQLHTPDGRVILNKEFPEWADGGDGYKITPLYAAPQPAEQPTISAYACTVPDDCETLHWRGQILSMNELVSAQPAEQQPAPDVTALVEALSESLKGIKIPSVLTPARAEFFKAGVHAAVNQLNTVLAAHRKQRPCPESIREGSPYNDPAFESLCREHEIWGTAAAAQCAVFWEGGKRAAEQQPAPDVTQLVEALEQAGLALHEMDDGHAALVDIDNALAAYRKGGDA